LKKVSNPEKKHGVYMISSSKLFPPEMCNRRAPPLSPKNTIQQNKTKPNNNNNNVASKPKPVLVFQLLSLADSNL
jgi:hypothetical protein